MPNLPRTFRRPIAAGFLLALALIAAQTAIAQTAPAALQPADAHHTIATLSATGVQIYVCKRDGNKPLAWVFKAPQADLYDAAGKLVVKHGAGPTWEAADGSKITGKAVQQVANSAEAGAIPMLLLQATSAGSVGLLSSARYVQRLQTHGGIAPAQPCTEEGQEGRSPYLAQYVFLD
ncbi:hypothetical protein PI87_26435 [Ralstonia sp. A12]|uniref:DUF3455 domain-containing protein n=1 Tax=Ralstonia sp. A12 TaxID=1217052 RepID=UPI0005734520|nr:DUF3455 domain-containing protein [Ralstonia sp. A12]KHK49140.1 hypothetical protein PI87_26435 [Ralstonia sp. A12]